MFGCPCQFNSTKLSGYDTDKAGKISRIFQQTGKKVFTLGKIEFWTFLGNFLYLYHIIFYLRIGSINTLTPIPPNVNNVISTQTDNHKYRKKSALFTKICLKFWNSKFNILCKIASTFLIKCHKISSRNRVHDICLTPKSYHNHLINDTQSGQISQKQDDVNHVPKCMSWHKAIVVITGRAHCFHVCIYIYIYIIPSCSEFQ